MIELANSYSCTGCGACLNACPKDAISMIEDSEGFLQPRIDKEKCIECKLCQRSCPVLSPIQINNSNQKVYAFINYTDRKSSSSGGAFSFFARKILKEGGIVFGATMDDKFKVYHISIDNIQDLHKLQGSKYIQSAIGHTYTDVKYALSNGRKVLFSGTPCQIGGLYKFLGKRWENQLTTLDLVCHGVPNQKAFDSYIKKLSVIKKFSNGKVINFSFRKLDSWSLLPTVTLSNSNVPILLSQESNAYMSAFYKGYTYRECCFSCKYANTSRIGTFTIADFWGLGSKGKKFRKNIASGVSLIIDNFNTINQYISTKERIYIEERSIEEAKLKNKNLNNPVKRPKERDTAITDLLDQQISLYDFTRKYQMLEPSYKQFIKSLFIKIVIKLGLYNIYKTISYKLGKTS